MVEKCFNIIKIILILASLDFFLIFLGNVLQQVLFNFNKCVIKSCLWDFIRLLLREARSGMELCGKIDIA